MNDWWAELDDEILACLHKDCVTTPAEVAGRLGITEATASSLLAMLARQGKVRICAVAPVRRVAARLAG
jgi:DNA-binding transcriptional regulator LsrR (DeoR family)